MKKLKRTLAVLLTVAAVLTLTACGNQPGNTSNGGAPAQVATYLYKTLPLLDCDPSVEFSNGIITMNNIYETLLYRYSGYALHWLHAGQHFPRGGYLRLAGDWQLHL